jgi:hypothetical protein
MSPICHTWPARTSPSGPPPFRNHPHTGERQNHIIHPEAPSAARVVYDYYGGLKAFPASWNDKMMAAVDKGDAARFNEQEVLNPEGWDC